MLINKGIKAKPTGLASSNQPKAIRLVWTQSADPQRSTFNVYWYPTATDATNDTNRILIGTEVKELTFNDNGSAINGRSALTVDAIYGYRITSVDIFGNESLKSDPVNIVFRAVESADIKDLAITAAKIQDAILTAAKFAPGVQPVENFATLAAAGAATPAGRLIFVAADSKLYKAVGGSWSSVVNTSDLTGTISDAQIAALNASKLTGTLDVARIASNALDITKFATSIRPVEIFATTAAAGTATEGRVIFVQADDKIYRGNGTSWVAAVPAADITGTLSDAQIAALAASKITGQIVGTQITDGAITTAKMTANTIDGSVITANTLNAAKILAGSITSTQFTANTINGNIISTGTLNADRIVAGSIQAAHIGANQITGRELLLGDFSNITDNGWSQGNLGGWSIAGNQGFTLETAAGDANGWRVQSNERDNATSQWIAVTPGDQYYFEAWVKNDLAATNAIIYMNCGDVNKGTLTWVNVAQTTTIGSWLKLSGIAVVPAGKYFVRMQLSNTRAAGSGGASIYWTKPVMRRAMGANLIVDGAITTAKMTANTIDGSVITANTLNAAKILAGSITSTQFTANTINGNIISTGTLNADRIVAGTIQAAQIATGAITASKLFIGDTSNMFPDPEFSEAVGMTREDNNLGGTSRYKGTLAANTTALTIYPPTIPVEPSTPYYVSGTYGADNGVSAAYSFRIDWFSKNAAGVLTFISSTTIGSYTGTAIGNAGAQVVAPANATRAQIVAAKAASAGAAKLAMTNVVMRRAMTGNLVVDGSITSSKISVTDLRSISATLGTVDISAAVIGTLQVDSINIKSDAVLPSKFFNRDFGNLVRDPLCIDLPVWVPGVNNLPLVSVDNSTVYSSSKKIQGETNGSTSTVSISSAPDIVVSPYETYFVSAVLGTVSGYNAATFRLKVNLYQLVNGVLTGPGETITVDTDSTVFGGTYLLSDNVTIGNYNRMSITAEIVGSSGVMKGTMSAPGVKKCKTLQESVFTAAAQGPFGTGVRTIQSISINNGYNSHSVTVLGSFRNASGAAKSYDVRMAANLQDFTVDLNYDLSNGDYATVQGSFNPQDLPQSGAVTFVDLNVQGSAGSNTISRVRLTAITSME